MRSRETGRWGGGEESKKLPLLERLGLPLAAEMSRNELPLLVRLNFSPLPRLPGDPLVELGVSLGGFGEQLFGFVRLWFAAAAFGSGDVAGRALRAGCLRAAAALAA